jgi:glucuronoarabinoxylan endo-1,4-beta-xylanase
MNNPTDMFDGGGKTRKLSPFLSLCTSLLIAAVAFVSPVSAQSGLTVNFNDVHQRIDGFGAADPWNPALTDAQADLFFSQTSGIGLSILRVGIDSNGNDMSAYSNATKAAARGAIVWAYPFSAPGAWKDNGTTNNGGHLLPQYYDAWATRLAGFAATLQKNAGVRLYGLSVQNEPDWTASWDTMLYTNQEMVNFVKVLGPKVAALSPRPKLMLAEVGGWSLSDGFTGAVLSDSGAAPYLDIVTAHQYGGVAAPGTTGKPIWETEMSSFDAADSSINNGLTVARWIHDAITIGNVSAWHFWWLNHSGTDNESLLNSGLTKRLYTLGNFSKFVRPGFVVVGTTAAPAGVSVTAYKNPTSGAFAIVAINQNGSDTPISVSLNGLTASSVTPWVTSSQFDLTAQGSVPVSGSSFSATLLASSVTTFVSNGSGPALDTTAPTAPSAAAANAGSATQVTVTWNGSTDNVAVTSYMIERCQGVGCAGFAQVATSTTTGFTDTALTPATSYTYRVRATDAAGNLSGYSNAASVTTPAQTATKVLDTQPPTAPGTPTVSLITTGEIDLSWAASSDNVTVTSYSIERCKGSGCTSFAKIATSATPGFNDTSVAAATTYRYRVRAADAANNVSGYSNITSATTPRRTGKK